MTEVLTLDDWNRAVRDQEDPKATSAEQEQQVNMLIQAAVAMEHITNDPDWDKFLSYVTAAQELVKKTAEGRKDQLASSFVVDQNEIMQLKTSLALLKGQELTLEWLLEIPKALKTQGEVARKFKLAMEQADDEESE